LVEAEPAGHVGLLGIRVDPDQVERAGDLDQDPGQQPVTAAQVESTTGRQRLAQQVPDLVGTPESGGRLKGVVAQEARQELLR
jgi:hypothetical protein